MDLVSPIPPMLAKVADSLPLGDGWRYEPKWDGFRCLVISDAGGIRLQSRTLKPLHESFPEVVTALRQHPLPLVLDGELIIGRGDDYSQSFADLQARNRARGERLHDLAKDLPATFVAFDQLTTTSGAVLARRPFAERRAALEATTAAWSPPLLLLTPQTSRAEIAQRWMALAGHGIEGVVAKRADAPYQPGLRSSDMVKVKAKRTIDCVVGGISPTTNGRHALLLGLHDDAGLVHYVGQSLPVPVPLMRSIEAEISIAPGRSDGFSGRQPADTQSWTGKPRSSWRAVPIHAVVEVSYDRLDGTFRHRPEVLRLRHDKAAEDCRFDQA